MMLLQLVLVLLDILAAAIVICTYLCDAIGDFSSCSIFRFEMHYWGYLQQHTIQILPFFFLLVCCFPFCPSDGGAFPSVVDLQQV
jgi:hypothetical protein